MTEKSVPSKNEEQRHIEAEKMKAEAKRALAVAKAKLAHAAIEEIEKRRKMSSIYSLHKRIIAHVEMMGRHTFYSTEGIEEETQNEIETYESIRFDFKEIMRLSDEKLERLFPKIKSYFETRIQSESEIRALTVLINIAKQEKQMWAYSRRMML